MAVTRRTPLAIPTALLLLALGVALVPGCDRKSRITAPEPPVCDVSPTALDFGVQALGAAGDTLTFTVTNRGGGTLAAKLGGVCGAFQVTCGCGNLSLGPNQSQTVSVRFVPAQLGTSTCTWAIGDSGTCAGVSCTGTAIRPAACRLSPTALAFGTQRVDSCGPAQSFTITNGGEAVLSGVVPDSAGPFRVSSGAGPFALAPGESRAVAVRFCPVREGAASVALAFAPGSCTLPCTGQGTLPPPACQVSEVVLEYGSLLVGECSERSFRITDVGTGPLSGTVPASCGPRFQVVEGAGAYTLEPGTSRTVTVRYCPQAGVRDECTLALGIPCASVRLVGSGLCRAKLAITSSPLSARVVFDNVLTSSVTPCTLTVLTPGEHLVSLQRSGYRYFAGPSTVNVPCAGLVTASYVGHHLTVLPVDETTWLDSSRPDANHCADTALVVGRTESGDTVRIALLRCPGLQPDVRMQVTKATLVVTQGDGPRTGLAMAAHPASGAWSACASTWSSPGTAWDGDAPVFRWFGSYALFDVTADANAFVTGAVPNRGWAIAPPGSVLASTFQRLVSSQAPRDRPYVELDWVDP